MSAPTKAFYLDWRRFILILTISLVYMVHLILLIYFYLGAFRGLRNIDEFIPEYSLKAELLTGGVFAMLVGLIIGILEFKVLRWKLRRFAYGRVILLKIGLYSILAGVVVICSSIFYASVLLNLWPWDYHVIQNALRYISGTGGLYVGSLTIVIITQVVFIIHVDEKMGQGVLFNLLLGKYHQPKELTRIFMFLDMKSSTAIAERLGHSEYFKLLNQYYADMTKPIISFKGEIYQYVGDEIIISWSMRNGLKQNRCINCFFAIQAIIQKNASLYQQRFGLIPEFRAGMHFGYVTTGEIGIIKRVITYSGDVLNTTARIREMCGDYGSDFLVSRELLDQIAMNGSFRIRDLGNLALRGKEQSIELISVELT